MMPILTITNLHKHFGGVKAINDFSVTLEKGKIYGLIGPNGAGKTTIFNTITGIYDPTMGDIALNGASIVGKAPYEISNLGIARTFQNIRLFGNLSVLDNVIIACHVDAKYGIFEAMTKFGRFKKDEEDIKEKCLKLLQIVGLQDMKDDIAGALPYGHQRKLEIARALATNPHLLLLDEPAAGMNEKESEELVQFIKNIHENFDLTILLIEHHMDFVMSLCDEIAVLNFGSTIAMGTPDEVKSNPAVIEAYLGGEEDA